MRCHRLEADWLKVHASQFHQEHYGDEVEPFPDVLFDSSRIVIDNMTVFSSSSFYVNMPNITS
jgi:hypothetical protein